MRRFSAEYEKVKTGKLAEVFVFSNFSRVPVNEVIAGDICAVTGLSDVSIGETICNTNDVIPLPSISVSLLFFTSFDCLLKALYMSSILLRSFQTRICILISLMMVNVEKIPCLIHHSILIQHASLDGHLHCTN